MDEIVITKEWAMTLDDEMLLDIVAGANDYRHAIDWPADEFCQAIEAAFDDPMKTVLVEEAERRFGIINIALEGERFAKRWAPVLAWAAVLNDLKAAGPIQ